MENPMNATPREGRVAKEIEKQTSKLPSDLFLWGGLSIIAASIVLHCVKQKHTGLMVGQWAAPLLIMGVYNKLVKQSGHDYSEPVPEETGMQGEAQPF